MWTPLGRAVVGVVWVVCGALMFACPPDDDSDFADEMPIWGLVVLALGVILLVRALLQRPRGSDGRHSSGRESPGTGRDHIRAVGASGIFLFGAGVLLWVGVSRSEIGVISTGVLLVTCVALLLPIAFPALRDLSRSE